MIALRLYLILGWTLLIAYTAFVIGSAGLDIAPAFFGAIGAGGWPGQFNLDFLMLLGLAALWTGWRNGWSPPGWGLALLALNLGGLFVLAYVLVLLHLERGDMRRVLLGARAGV